MFTVHVPQAKEENIKRKAEKCTPNYIPVYTYIYLYRYIYLYVYFLLQGYLLCGLSRSKAFGLRPLI